MTEPPVKVLFIAGSGRSGSTLLTRMLGETEGFFAGGEMRYLWRRGVIERRLCGCGAPVASCPVWSAVLADVSHGEIEARRLDASLRALTRGRRLPRLLFGRQVASRRSSPGDEDEVREELRRVYAAVVAQTGARWIVDSSKLPTFGWLLGSLPGIDVTVVHLIRDARGAAFSWLRWRELTDDAPRPWMQRQSALKSAWLWLVWNAAAEALWRRDARTPYLRVRYEDLVTDPTATLAAVLRHCEGELTASGPGGARPLHLVAGNPSRLGAGAVQVVHDREWEHSMRRRDSWLVSLMTFPALRHHGYRLRRETSPRATQGAASCSCSSSAPAVAARHSSTSSSAGIPTPVSSPTSTTG